MSRHPTRLTLLIACGLPLMHTAGASGQATQPTTTHAAITPRSTTAPATQSAENIRRYFDGLADADAKVRQQSVASLLALGRDDLPQLARIVEAGRPLAPAQTNALHDIVVHVYLTGETYDADWTQGFLGLQSPEESNESVLVAIPEPADKEDPQARPQERRGVPVENRLPGFCGYGALQTGDVILAFTIALTPEGEVGDAPAAASDVLQFTRNLENWIQLTEVVRRIPAGTRVVLDVLRRGTVSRVPIVLSARPIWAVLGAEFKPILEQREQSAEAYWKKVFAPLVGELVS